MSRKRFNMVLSDGDLKKLKALAKLEGEAMSTVVRMALRNAYRVKFNLKRGST
jgi:hypothetical protein